MKRLHLLAISPFLLLIVFLAGPKPGDPQLSAALPAPPAEAASLSEWVSKLDRQEGQPRPGCEASIMWADDSLRQRSSWSLVYLHGFSACHEEGRAMAEAFARRYGCNLYLSRLQSHGLESDEPLLTMNADSLYQSAARALAVGQQLGEQVILMGTSTGGTLALKLAAEFPEAADAVFLYSPNIRIFDPKAAMATLPWGLQIARAVKGGNYNEPGGDEYEQQYWNSRYRLEAVVELQRLVEHSMIRETFIAVKQPLFLGYYYKDDIHQDSTVSVEAMLDMYEWLGTDADRKRKEAFPDAGVHVICNPRVSHDYRSVEAATFRFAEEVLGLAPAGGI